MTPPSGRQHTIERGAQQAVIVEVGGALRSYSVHDRDVLDGYREDEMASGARGQPLIPWPNRIQDGRYAWGGDEHQLPLSEPDSHNAIHGLVRWASWTATQQSAESVEMQHVLHPQPGYPFTLALTIRYSLGADGLTVTTQATNLGSEPLPYGSGQHPYLATERGVDEGTLELAAETYIVTDDRGLPVERASVAGTSYDFREAARMGAVELDTAYTDLARDGDGRAWVTFVDTSNAITRLWVDESYPYIELFTGDSLPDPSRRRRSLGVEPMTAPPNALHKGVDITRLDPGATTTSTWGVRIEQ
jgi:aldose 1-epimerase